MFQFALMLKLRQLLRYSLHSRKPFLQANPILEWRHIDRWKKPRRLNTE